MDPKPKAKIAKKKHKKKTESKVSPFESEDATNTLKKWAEEIKESKTRLTAKTVQCFGSLDMVVDGHKISSSFPRMDTLQQASDAVFRCAGAVITKYFVDHHPHDSLDIMNRYVGDPTDMKAEEWYDRLKIAFNVLNLGKALLLVACVVKIQEGRMTKHDIRTLEPL